MAVAKKLSLVAYTRVELLYMDLYKNSNINKRKDVGMAVIGTAEP